MSNLDIFCLVKALELQLGKKGELVLNVTGNSMLPEFAEGDRIKVRKADNISAGDVIVFVYEMNLHVHRILYMRENVLYCKGDNSFRIEEITYNDIVGKVTGIIPGQAETVRELVKPDEEFLSLSLAVGREFLRLGCDREKICASEVYLRYQACANRQFDARQGQSGQQDDKAGEQDEDDKTGRRNKVGRLDMEEKQ